MLPQPVSSASSELESSSFSPGHLTLLGHLEEKMTFEQTSSFSEEEYLSLEQSPFMSFLILTLLVSSILKPPYQYSELEA